jgi:hypothetical protein
LSNEVRQLADVQRELDDDDAVKTTISIDGPGVYKTYAANASDSLPFNCSSSHSFYSRPTRKMAVP